MSPMRALVVDDERNMRLMLAELLTSEGYSVTEAAARRSRRSMRSPTEPLRT